MLKTPQNGSSFLIAALSIYFISPVFEWFSLQSDLENGKFAANADSIGLGLAMYIFALLVAAPMFIGFTFWIVWKYPGAVWLFGYNKKRLLWSFIWTFVFGFLAVENLIFGFMKFLEGNISEVMRSLIFGYLCLQFRAAIVFRANLQCAANEK